jgi:hypothetical protein
MSSALLSTMDIKVAAIFGLTPMGALYPSSTERALYKKLNLPSMIEPGRPEERLEIRPTPYQYSRRFSAHRMSFNVAEK